MTWTDGIVAALSAAPSGLPTRELSLRACPDSRPAKRAISMCLQQLGRLERVGAVKRIGAVKGLRGQPETVWALATGPSGARRAEPPTPLASKVGEVRRELAATNLLIQLLYRKSAALRKFLEGAAELDEVQREMAAKSSSETATGC